MVTKRGENLLYKDISYQIRGACFEVYKNFGGAFKEKVVDRALTEELKSRGLKVEDQKPIDIYYKGKKIASYTPDKIINNSIILEIKCKPYLTKEDERQFWYYLRGSNYKLGFLINFGSNKLEIKRRIYDKARNPIRVNPRLNPRLSASTNKGFTMIEVLVVVFIIALMSGIIFSNYRQGGQQFALQRAAHKLALDIRRVEEMAMSAKEFEGAIPPGGYGVHFSSLSPYHYVLFADCDGDLEYDNPDCGLVSCAADCAFATPTNPFPESIEGEVEIEKPVWICKVCGENVDEQTIVFTPPEPKVTLTPGGNSTLIVLKNNGQTKTVRVNKAGLIEIE